LSFFFLHVSSQQNTKHIGNSCAWAELSDGVPCYCAKTFEAEECHTATEPGRKGFDCRLILSTQPVFVLLLLLFFSWERETHYHLTCRFPWLGEPLPGASHIA